jgi:hypothetical protein
MKSYKCYLLLSPHVLHEVLLQNKRRFRPLFVRRRDEPEFVPNSKFSSYYQLITPPSSELDQTEYGCW